MEAETLFEAAAMALAAFKDNEWVLDDVGPATRLDVEVPGPSARHSVPVQQIRRWAEGSSVSPEVQLRKERVKAMLPVRKR